MTNEQIEESLTNEGMLDNLVASLERHKSIYKSLWKTYSYRYAWDRWLAQ